MQLCLIFIVIVPVIEHYFFVCPGAFLKSSSFNSSSSKPKVQLIDVPRKKIGKDTSLGIKEGVFGNVSKSMSSRTTDTGSSSGNDSQAKMIASKVYHSQEGKSPKQLKDGSTEANAPAASTEQKLTSRSSLGSSYANSTRDLKGLRSDGKRSSLTKQVSNLNRNRLENPVTSGMIPIILSIYWYFCYAIFHSILFVYVFNHFSI